MTTGDSSDRLRAIFADLLKRRLAESLGDVQRALSDWREGELSVFEAHAEVLRHVGRAELVAEQVSNPDADVAGLLRNAFDCGIVGRGEFVELTGEPPESVEPAPAGGDLGAALPAKVQVVEELLGNGPILVHVDARADGVSVPASFAGDPRLVLRFGYQLTPPIADLDIGETEMSGTLTFGGVPFCCVIPWEAVYAVVAESDQKGMVWPDDVPSAVLDDLSTRAEPRVETAVGDDKRGSHLKLVK